MITEQELKELAEEIKNSDLPIKTQDYLFGMIEKAIPKKVVRKPNTEMTHEECRCPNCGILLKTTDEHHCKCGQAIEWSEEE